MEASCFFNTFQLKYLYKNQNAVFIIYFNRYISGSLHYSRVPAFYWKDRLTKMHSAGLNAVQTYIPWNFHNPFPGVFQFQGDHDVVEFLKTAQDVGLLVVLRAGPYICGEWEMGGLPSWLLRNTSIVLRSSDAGYLKQVDEWYSVLFPKLKSLLYENGGPIISVQVENEYGSYYTCDKNYMKHLEMTFRRYLGPDVLLFTTDGDGDGYLKCGTLIPDLYATVDFGVTNNPNFEPQRQYEPHGPLVNSEFYTGWLDHWGEPHQRRDGAQFAKSLDILLKMNVSVSMYMFEGGTNFGFWNGANSGGNSYSPQPTSYDYDAPLTEAGDPTAKFTLIRNVIMKYQPVPTNVPPATTKIAYGKILFYDYVSLFDSGLAVTQRSGINPYTFEEIEQDYGFMLYKTDNNISIDSSLSLIVSELHDRASIYWNSQYSGAIIRQGQIAGNITFIVNSSSSGSGPLELLVENMGRINYGSYINDQKGIIDGVFASNKRITQWTSYSYPLNNTDKLKVSSFTSLRAQPHIVPPKTAVFYIGTFEAGYNPADTFLSLNNWNKGVAFVNDFNLGRYWTAKGPQKTLFVPANILKPTPAANRIVVFEIDSAPCVPPDYTRCFVEFTDTPDLGVHMWN